MQSTRKAPRARIRAGTVGKMKLSNKQQLRLAGTCSDYWRRAVQFNHGTFPPAADVTPMKLCNQNPRNLRHISPVHYLTRNPDTGRLECEDCRMLEYDRKMARLRREEAMPDEVLEAEQQRERQRRKGLPVTHSPSGQAFIELGNARAQVIEMKLPSSKPRILQQQVERYLALAPQVGEAKALKMTFGEENTPDSR